MGVCIQVLKQRIVLNAIPKQAFVMWLAMKNCLTTGDRLVKWGYKCEVSCVFCRNEWKAENTFSLSVATVQEVMSRCNVNHPPVDWDDVVWLRVCDWKQKSLTANICRLVLSSTIYNMWRNRNETKHEVRNRGADLEKNNNNNNWDVRPRVLGKDRFKRNVENVVMCRN